MSTEILEDYDWESVDSEDWEYDEAFTEDFDSVEDIGERSRRRRQQKRAFQPGRGVRGIALRGSDGRVNKARFPTPLATAAETNRGLAKQELARRTLEARLNRLETRSQGLQNKDGSINGLVTLAIGGGLAAYGAIQAGKKAGDNLFGKWAAEPSTTTAALVSATQLATTGAKLMINGQRPSGVGLAADIYAAAQLAAFSYGTFHEPDKFEGADDLGEAQERARRAAVGTVVVIRRGGPAYRVVETADGERLLWSLTPADRAGNAVPTTTGKGPEK